MKLKSVFLFLALILPVLIFLFLRFFGKNEFAVEPLFTTEGPEVPSICQTTVSLPYHIPDSVRGQFNLPETNLVVVTFGELKPEAMNELSQINERFGKESVRLKTLAPSLKMERLRDCIFFMKDKLDIALVDADGTIRGQYKSREREEIDRLITELTIILKRY